jgi:hypothetical protein
MSNVKPLVVAFSEGLLNAPVAERVKAAESALLFLRREGATSAAQDLAPFLTPAFYLIADTKRDLYASGYDVQVVTRRVGIQEFGYVASGEITRAELTPAQRDVLNDIGFETRELGRPTASSEQPAFKKIALRRRPDISVPITSCFGV